MAPEVTQQPPRWRDARARFVRTSCRLRPVPLIPEIRLHLADEAFTLWEATERESGEAGQPPPFWAFAWPGGQALARYLLDRPGTVAGRTVLDVGSGSGLAAIAAARAGAAAVLASEVDSLATAAIALNAHANGATVEVTGDVLDGDGDGADVILAGDIWYERGLAERALGMLRRATRRGAEVFIGDIGRAFLPTSLLSELAAYDVPVIAELEDAAVKRASILTLRRPTQQSADGCPPCATRRGAGTPQVRR
jgi:predicted nicotinamide N-methyase